MAKDKADLGNGMWHWYHNISECYYHVQLTIKYRRTLFDEEVKKVVLAAMEGFQERYGIAITEIGFDQNHVHLLCQFLPKYSGGQVIRLMKSITGKQVFEKVPRIKDELWGGEFWTDGYYIGTISARGNRKIIERYIQNQGRHKDIQQLQMFTIGT